MFKIFLFTRCQSTGINQITRRSSRRKIKQQSPDLIRQALHSSGTSLSLLKDIVSRQPSPKVNKQPQSYESLPDGLTLPTHISFTNTSCEGVSLAATNGNNQESIKYNEVVSNNLIRYKNTRDKSEDCPHAIRVAGERDCHACRG